MGKHPLRPDTGITPAPKTRDTVSALPDFPTTSTGIPASTESPGVTNKDASRTVRLPGTEGYVQLPPGWNAAEEGRKYLAANAPTMSGIPANGMDESTQNIRINPFTNRAEGTLGTFTGPSLADKEKAIMGGIEHPGDFDYNRFKEGVHQLGIKITPQTMIQLYGTALKEHENKVTQYNDLLKARMQFGEGSPQMISAKSTAQYHDISSRIAGAKAGPEMAQVLASIDKTRAETAGIPATTEHQKALTGYYQAMTENPEMKTNIAQLNAGMKMVSEELDPTKRMDLYNKVMGAFEANKARVYGRYEGIYGNLRKQYKMLPEKMTPGDYDLGDGHKIRITPDLTVEQI